MATLNRPQCHSPRSMTWIVRTKKRQLSGRADGRDRARFAKARSYMLRKDALDGLQEYAPPLRNLRSESVVFTD